MKIGLECQRLFRAKRHGIEIVAMDLIHALNKTKEKNDIIVFAKDGVNKDLLDTSIPVSKHSLRAFPYPVWEQISLPLAFKQEQVDILHCMSNTAPVNMSIPLVITIHDIIYLENLNFKGTAYQNFGNLYRRYLVPLAARNADKILTVSEFEKEQILKHLKVPDDRIEVVYNAVSDSFRVIDPTDDQLAEARKKYNLPEKFFLFLGNTAPKKNTERVIKAYGEFLKTTVNPVPLVIVDAGGDFLHGIIKENDLEQSFREGKIRLIDYVPHRELVLIYNLASCFLYLSLRESFGLPILEAMACGTPVITSSTSSMPEIAGGAALLADPYSVSDMALKMKAFTEQPDLINDLIEKGIKNKKKFTWTRSAEQLLTIYENILKKNYQPVHS